MSETRLKSIIFHLKKFRTLNDEDVDFVVEKLESAQIKKQEKRVAVIPKKIIKGCHECPHSGHSGAFTIGGARSICNHNSSCRPRRSKEDFKAEYPKYFKESEKDKWEHWSHHWFHRITEGDIPDWCPLLESKNGED